MSEKRNVAIVGAGVNGLTTAVLLRERGFEPVIFADEFVETTSAVAAALWLPYEAEPERLVTQWALLSYGRFQDLAGGAGTGVRMVDFEYRSAFDDVVIPLWAETIGYRRLSAGKHFLSGYKSWVPRMDTTLYLPYLKQRAGLTEPSYRMGRLRSLEDIPKDFPVVVNCSGYGSRALVPDEKLEPHRGQVVVVEKIPGAPTFVLDEPLTYVIPRENDCVLGGANVIKDDTTPDHELSEQIVSRCMRMLDLQVRPQFKKTLVGIRPFRRETVRVQAARLRDGRIVVHNYGHGGCGLSVSWGSAEKAVELVERFEDRP